MYNAEIDSARTDVSLYSSLLNSFVSNHFQVLRGCRKAAEHVYRRSSKVASDNEIK